MVRARLIPLALAALLVGPLLLVSQQVATGAGAYRPYEVRYLPNGSALSLLSPGAKLTIGNAYWLAAVQYTGDQHLVRGSYAQLFQLVDLVTEMDPGHGYAYQSAGIVLSSAGRLEESDRILKKGMEPGRPNWWSYPFYLAFNDYFYRGDYASAARWARIAARTPGASTNISHLALALEVKRGDPAGGLALLQELLAATTDPQIRERLEEQARLAKLQLDFSRLDAAVAQYFAANGRPPRNLSTLVAAGLLPAIPEEPFGGQYELRGDGTVHSTGRDFRFRPPEPGRRALPAGQAAWQPPTFLEHAP